MTAATPPPPIPDRLPMLAGYRIERVLGRGGMGVVYEAVQEKLGRTVAVKECRRSAADSGKAGAAAASAHSYQRFLREARILAQMEDHPNIVRIYDLVSDAEGTDYIVMQYIAGRTLAEELTIARGRLAPAAALKIAHDVATALRYAHETGIVHRDIKPQNIMLASSGLVKVMDFGLARSFDVTPLTSTDATFGTLHYMSPEQLEGARAADFRADIYSLGVVMYVMFCGALPFDDTNPVGLIDKIRFATPPRPRDLVPAMLPEVEAVIVQAISRRPGDRHRSAEELRERIAGLMQLAGQPTDMALGPMRGSRGGAGDTPGTTPAPDTVADSDVPTESRMPSPASPRGDGFPAAAREKSPRPAGKGRPAETPIRGDNLTVFDHGGPFQLCIECAARRPRWVSLEHVESEAVGFSNLGSVTAVRYGGRLFELVREEKIGARWAYWFRDWPLGEPVHGVCNYPADLMARKPADHEPTRLRARDVAASAVVGALPAAAQRAIAAKSALELDVASGINAALVLGGAVVLLFTQAARAGAGAGVGLYLIVDSLLRMAHLRLSDAPRSEEGDVEPRRVGLLPLELLARVFRQFAHRP